MLFIKIFIKTLLITKFCQSLTIYEPRIRKSNIKEYSTLQTQNSTGSYKELSYPQRSILSGGTLLNLIQQPGYFHSYPDLYQFNNQSLGSITKTLTHANEQPAATAEIESETLNDFNTKKEKDKQQQQQQRSFVNYNNAVYHINSMKRASPWAKFFVRKQRNLNENHDDTNKLIEQNNEERIKNSNEVNDQQITTASSSVANKQPLALTGGPTTKTSHEIRYLHDIFLNYPKPHHVNFGHVQLSPALFEKRFQSQKLGNRYKGEILWLDNTGGFAQHYWDLAQGRL